MKIRLEMCSGRVIRTIRQEGNPLNHGYCQYVRNTISCSRSSLFVSCGNRDSRSSYLSSPDLMPSVNYNVSSKEHMSSMDYNVPFQNHLSSDEFNEHGEGDSTTVILSSDDEETLSKTDLLSEKSKKNKNNVTSLNYDNDDGFSDISTVPGSLLDDSFDDSVPALQSEDIRISKAMPTEVVKNITDYLPEHDTRIAMNNSQLDEISDEVTIQRPNIIVNEACPEKIVLPSNTDDSNLLGFPDKEQRRASLEAEKWTPYESLGFLQESTENLSFEYLSKNVQREPIIYDFPKIIREALITSRSETPVCLYLRDNLPSQVDLSGINVLAKNVIKSSIFDSHSNLEKSGYLALVPEMQKWTITSDEERKILQSRIKSEHRRIIKKAKLKLKRKKAKIVTQKSSKSSLKNSSKSRLKSVKKKESLVHCVMTRSLTKVLKNSLKSEETSKTIPPRSRDKREIKDVRIILTTIDISSYRKDIRNEKLTRNSIHSIKNVEYHELSSVVDNNKSYEEEQSLFFHGEIPKKSTFNIRRSNRKSQPIRKSILLSHPNRRRSLRLQAKVEKVNKRVTFSPNISQYEY